MHCWARAESECCTSNNFPTQALQLTLGKLASETLPSALPFPRLPFPQSRSLLPLLVFDLFSQLFRIFL